MPVDALNADQLIVVANRLPLEPIYADEDQDSNPVSWRLAPGGLVSALESILRTRPSIWVGAGDGVPDIDLGDMQLEAVHLDPEDARDYYEGFSNTAIWPLYHSAVVTPEFHRHHFSAYARVNEAFADHVVSIAAEGATVWVHDYQLQLLPQLLRERRPDLVIGFFLHIPFPPSELFAQLPWRHSILQGLLGADLIGFQTHGDATNFRDATERFLGLRIDAGKVNLSDRCAEVGVFPIGIDAAGFAEIAADPAVRARAVALRTELGDPKILLLGVDRLDYTKGIDIRLRAFAEVLESGQLDPTETVFVQVAVPSREDLSEYQNIRDEIELLVGRFNGSLSSLGATPIHYMRRGLEREELVALYLAADVMLVTPLRDGMNLVCKEYIASRNDDSGALILSEFTGAAAQLTDAWLVNPFDTVGLEEAIRDVVLSDDDDRRNRMQRMRKVVFDSDSTTWANEFLTTLHSISVGATDLPKPLPMDLDSIPLSRLTSTSHLLVCCDYDGTLAPLVDDPSKARPLTEAVAALRALSLLPSTTVAVVSGRALRDVAALSRLPSEIHLVGSHGAEIDHEFTPDSQQRRLLNQCIAASSELASGVSGAHIEIKPGSVAIHVRQCTAATGTDLIERIVMGPGQFPGIAVQQGKNVIELSVMHAQKSDAVDVLRHRVGASMILFIGDDVTDESVFTTLSGPDVGVKVGDGPTAAPWRVDSPQDVANLLFELCEQRERWLLGGHATPIEDHLLLSNQYAVALLSPQGSIDWFCAPEPDSPAVFAAILGDATSGHFSIGPRHGQPPLSQSYLPGTLSARTRWAGLTTLDYLPVCETDDACQVRIIRCISGREPALVSFAPRPDFGAASVTLEATPDGLLVISGADPMALHSPGVTWEIHGEAGHHWATATIDASSHDVVLELVYGSNDASAPSEAEGQARSRTERHWRDWLATLTLPGVRRDDEERSALTLRALCYRPTGGILAAATSSLPERIGGIRNWDYRYCWIRDAALTARELVNLGSMTEAEAFIQWLLGLGEIVTSPERLHPLYSLHGRSISTEAVIDSLPGYAGSRPVRVGNAARGQLQLDVFGPVSLLIDAMAVRRGHVTDDEWGIVTGIVDAIGLRWQEPDHGIWEVRHQPRQHTHSRMMCWVAVDRALSIAALRGANPLGWDDLRSTIGADIEANGWSTERGAYVAAFDLAEADAAVLQGILEGYPAPLERIQGTVTFIERELRLSGGVYRYLYDDGLPSGEGAMHICAAWLAGAYVHVGAPKDALQLLDATLDAAGMSGLLPEMVDPASGRGLGNHPQAYSHIGVLATARLIAESRAALEN